MGLHLNLNPLHPRMLCAIFGWNWPSGSWGEDFQISLKYFRYFVIISPWTTGGLFIWRIWVLNIQEYFVPSLVKISPVVLEKIIFKFANVFSLYLIISTWKRAGPFIWTNLNPLHTRMHCAKFGWNWPCGSGEEDFF